MGGGGAVGPPFQPGVWGSPQNQKKFLQRCAPGSTILWYTFGFERITKMQFWSFFLSAVQFPFSFSRRFFLHRGTVFLGRTSGGGGSGVAAPAAPRRGPATPSCGGWTPARSAPCSRAATSSTMCPGRAIRRRRGRRRKQRWRSVSGRRALAGGKRVRSLRPCVATGWHHYAGPQANFSHHSVHVHFTGPGCIWCFFAEKPVHMV